MLSYKATQRVILQKIWNNLCDVKQMQADVLIPSVDAENKNLIGWTCERGAWAPFEHTLIIVTFIPKWQQFLWLQSFKFNHILMRSLSQGVGRLRPSFSEPPSFTFQNLSVTQRTDNHKASDVITVCVCVCVHALSFNAFNLHSPLGFLFGNT